MNRNADRVQRIKDARTEAAKEIDALKAQKNAEFRTFELEVLLHRIMVEKISLNCNDLLRHSNQWDRIYSRVSTRANQICM